MGKEIAPRVVNLVPNPASEKRDIAGFNAALNYATGALKTSPEVQLGTGEGGSGVGITQKPGMCISLAMNSLSIRSIPKVFLLLRHFLGGGYGKQYITPPEYVEQL